MTKTSNQRIKTETSQPTLRSLNIYANGNGHLWHSANDLLAHMHNRRLRTPNCSIRFTAYLLAKGKHEEVCQTARNILTTSSLAATAILLTFVLSSQYLSFFTLKNGPALALQTIFANLFERESANQNSLTSFKPPLNVSDSNDGLRINGLPHQIVLFSEVSLIIDLTKILKNIHHQSKPFASRNNLCVLNRLSKLKLFKIAAADFLKSNCFQVFLEPCRSMVWKARGPEFF